MLLPPRSAAVQLSSPPHPRRRSAVFLEAPADGDGDGDDVGVTALEIPFALTIAGRSARSQRRASPSAASI